MARLTFPDEGSRSAFRTAPSGRPLTSAAGAAALVYLDAGATTLADIQTTAGAAIAGSSLNLDAYSRFPLFLGPADGTDTLYVVVDGGPVSPMYARVDDRLDAVKATADAAETPAGAAAKVSAEATTRAAADSAEATARAAAVTAAQAAAVQRSNHTGTQLAATVSDFSTAVVTAASGAYFPLAATAAALPAGTHLAHRGNGQVNLEDTLDAFRASVAQGARAIKCDVYPLATGALAVMHDSTTTRTTTTTSNVSDHTPASWANLVIPGTLLGPGAANSKPPLWEDVLNEFGGKVVILVEEKDLTTGGTAVMNSIIRRGLQKSVVVINSDTTLTSLAPFVAAGIPVMFQYNGPPITAPTPQAAIAAGATFIDIGYSYTDAQIQTVAAACAAAGVRLFGFTCKRRFEAARMLSLGCTDIISDQSAYTSASGQIASADRFKVGVPMLGVSVNNDQTPNWLGAAGSYRRAFPASQSDVYECQGYMATSKTTYTISGTVTLDANDSDTSRHPGILVCAPDDAPYQDGNLSQSGYHCFARTNGGVQISKVTRGATTNGVVGTGSAVNLGNTAGSALVVGQSYPFTIQVTPTQVIFTINGVTVTVTDATFRGPYCYIGKTGAGGLAASYSGLSISPTG